MSAKELFSNKSAVIASIAVALSPLIVFYSLIASMLLSLFLLIRKRANENTVKLIFLYIPAVTFIYIISGFHKNMPHYYLIAYPYIILVFSGFISMVFDRISSRWVKAFILFIIFIHMLLLSIKKTDDLMNIKTGTAYGGDIEGYTEIIK